MCKTKLDHERRRLNGNTESQKTQAVISILACTLLLLQVTASACVIVPSEPLDVEADVGSIHFKGEIADFYVLVSSSGAPMNATLTAHLCYDGALYGNLTSLVQYVDTGLYRIPYTIPARALIKTDIGEIKITLDEMNTEAQ